MIEKEFLDAVIKRFAEYKSLGEKTFDQLNEDQMHIAPNAASNSIAVIIQHLHGNMLSRWTNFLTEDGEKPWRQRDDEFETHAYTKQELLDKWDEGWNVFLQTLASLAPNDLEKTITIRTQPMKAFDAVLRQLAHYGYHVGQIVYVGRWLKGDA